MIYNLIKMEENKNEINMNNQTINDSDKNNIKVDNENANNKELNKMDEINLLIDSLMDLFCKKQYKKILKLCFMRDDEQKAKKEKVEEDKAKNEENKENSLDDKDSTNNNEWVISYLQTASIQKIMQKKNQKYYKISKANHFYKYIENENKVINKWLLFIKESIKEYNENKESKIKDNIQCFLEFIIKFILQKCVTLSKNCIDHKNIKEAVCFLSLGINLINHTHIFFKSPESFFLCGKIYLFLSSILIGDSNYETPKNFINLACIFFYTSLEALLFSNPKQISYSVFNLLNQEEQNYDIFTKIIFYLSICFYNLGICFENQGFPYDSFYAYKQSKFFSSILEEKNEDIQLFYNYVKDIEKRQLMRNRIIIFFERFVTKQDLVDVEKPIKKVYNEFFANQEKKAKKFLMLENYISNMKLVDVDKDEPNLFDRIDKHFKYNVNLVTKKIHLLDYLMSDNFRDTINNMRKIRINKLDSETIDIIQKKIINIKNNEREKISLKFKNERNQSQKEKEKEKEKDNFKTIDNIIREKQPINLKLRTISSANTINSRKKTRVSSSNKNSQNIVTDITLKSESGFSFNSRPTTAQNESNNKRRKYKLGYFTSLKSLSKRNQILSFEKSKSNTKTKDTENEDLKKGNKLYISASPKNKFKKNKKIKFIVPKYSYDKYVFHKSFLRKKNILENQYTNELLFQKQLLKTKHTILNIPEKFNIKDVQENCEKFYHSTFDQELMNARERNIFFNNNKKENNSKLKDKKWLNNFLSSQKGKEIIINELVNNKKKDKIVSPNKNNKEYIDKLFRDIIYLNEKEKLIEKNIKINK